jgi:hypothetical protein
VFDFNDPETFWLNVTNIALGVVTLVCLLAVAGVVFKEVVQRVRQRATVLAANDDHAFVMPGLGLTMADGGERLDKVEKPAKMTPPAKKELPGDDPRNIIRSTN